MPFYRIIEAVSVVLTGAQMPLYRGKYCRKRDGHTLFLLAFMYTGGPPVTGFVIKAEKTTFAA